MAYFIDAWLDRPQPYLRVLNRETGEVCLRLEQSALDELREQGDLDLSALNSAQPCVVKEQLLALFLFSYAKALNA